MYSRLIFVCMYGYTIHKMEGFAQHISTLEQISFLFFAGPAVSGVCCMYEKFYMNTIVMVHSV